MVTPELVEAMDCDQVPPCGPGLNSQIPDDSGLYWKGYIETPVQPYGLEGHGPAGPGPMIYGPGGGMPAGPGYQQFGPEQVIPDPVSDEEIPMTRAASQRSGAVASDGSAGQPARAASSRRRPHGRPPAGTSARAGSYNPSNPQLRVSDRSANANSAPPGLIGPIGYDVKN